MEIKWEELENWERRALREALEWAEEENLDVRGFTIITNDTADNWLRIGGEGYAKDYENTLSQEEIKEGKYIVGRPHGSVVLWCAE